MEEITGQVTTLQIHFEDSKHRIKRNVCHISSKRETQNLKGSYNISDLFAWKMESFDPSGTEELGGKSRPFLWYLAGS